MTDARPCIVAVCFSRGADLVVWRVGLDDDQRRRLEGALLGLLELGSVAAFVVEVDRSCGWDDLISVLGGRVGQYAVDACLASPPPRSPRPAFMVPVWPFDHEIGGAPASTAQFLGLDLELIAAPSPDEELGAYLPARDGRWLIHARPLGT